MPKSTQVFPLCKFRRNFRKLSIVQKYFKNQMIDKAVTTCKISKLILLSYVILTGFFCKKLRKNLGEMFMHFLGKMIWEKNPCYKRILFCNWANKSFVPILLHKRNRFLQIFRLPFYAERSCKILHSVLYKTSRVIYNSPL